MADVRIELNKLPVVHFRKRFEHSLLLHEFDEALILFLRSIANVDAIRLAEAHAFFHETANLSLKKKNSYIVFCFPK